MLHRLTCFLCCVLLAVCPLLSALAQDSFVMAGYDGEKSTHEWETNQFFARMQQRTGLTFTFRQYNEWTKWQEAKAEMFTEGEMPDVLFKAALSTEELIRLTDGGQLIDLAPLLAQNTPNLNRLLDENPEWRRAITLPNGRIGALPAIQRSAPQNAMWINQAWLKRLGLEMPVDVSSLHEVLVAFRDRDPNGNGKKDEIPFAFLGPWELKFLSHAWGVAANDYNIYLDEADQVHYWPQEDSFIELAKTMRDWFAEGLLDPAGFTTVDTLRRVTDSQAAVPFGVMLAPTPVNLVPYSASEQYVLLEPLMYDGRQIYRDLFGQITRGTFAITSACEDPSALLRWVDVLYTEEGAIEAMAGVEGESYEVDEDDGSWDWIGGVENMTMDDINTLTVYDSGDMPWMFPDAFYNRYAEDAVREVNLSMERLNQFVVQPFPASVTLTAEESAYAAALQQELGAYVDISLARFVLGEVPINDETIAAFREGLSQRGMEDMIAFWQEMALKP